MTMFASKTPRDLNHDPLPWRVAFGPWRGSRMDARYVAEAEHDPRPEFDHAQHNEPNPILVNARGDAISVYGACPTRWVRISRTIGPRKSTRSWKSNRCTILWTQTERGRTTNGQLMDKWRGA